MVERVNATENAQLAYSTTTLYGATVNDAATEAHPIEVSSLFADPYRVHLCVVVATMFSIEGPALRRHSVNGTQAITINRMTRESSSCVTCHMPLMRGKLVKDGEER